MQSKAKSVNEYLQEIPEDRAEYINTLRKTILDNLPKGMEETMNYGMIGYVIPHSIYPDGYHCSPKDPLPFANIASQKNSINFYHMGIYAKPEILDWFKAEYPKYCKRKLDMGKSCIRFKKFEEIPYKLIGELMQKMSTQEWIDVYEENYKKSTK